MCKLLKPSDVSNVIQPMPERLPGALPAGGADAAHPLAMAVLSMAIIIAAVVVAIVLALTR